MKFEPNYKPFNEAIKTLVDSLTEKQRTKYHSMRGYFEDRLLKISNSKKMQAKIKEVLNVRDECEENYRKWFNDFHSNFSGTLKACVLWFNETKGWGFVRVTGKNGESIKADIYACNIKNKKTWFSETACVYYKKNQEIDVELSFSGYCCEIFVIGLTPGHFDKESWERLDHDKLAFKCDENGNAINGLFG